MAASLAVAVAAVAVAVAVTVAAVTVAEAKAVAVAVDTGCVAEAVAQMKPNESQPTSFTHMPAILPA